MLTATTKHALRALIALAKRPAGEPMLGRDLAVVANIPPNYLAKILLSLRRAGMVKATRGSGGGYWLGVSPRKLVLMKVVEVFEGLLAQPECLLGYDHACSDRYACSAHGAWGEVRMRYLDFLKKTTIADISMNPGDFLPPKRGRSASTRRRGGAP